jgi:CRISPR/Cas system CMR-associated protein Cmr1 (group 7 of RAMP superfamily)
MSWYRMQIDGLGSRVRSDFGRIEVRSSSVDDDVEVPTMGKKVPGHLLGFSLVS